MSDTLQTQFNVGMTCNGCANAVNKILTKIEGVVKIDADVPNKKVIVTHTEAAKSDDMLKALKKWGEAAGKFVELVKV